jgi:hypothetical protein
LKEERSGPGASASTSVTGFGASPHATADRLILSLPFCAAGMPVGLDDCAIDERVFEVGFAG